MVNLMCTSGHPGTDKCTRFARKRPTIQTKSEPMCTGLLLVWVRKDHQNLSRMQPG